MFKKNKEHRLAHVHHLTLGRSFVRSYESLHVFILVVSVCVCVFTRDDTMNNPERTEVEKQINSL